MDAALVPFRPSTVPLRSAPVSAQIQRCGGVQCPPGTCGHDQDETAYRSGDDTPGPAQIPPSVAKVLGTPGRVLDAATRSGVEARLGHDFGQVRIHTDAEAAESAHAVHAQAYTFGRHVVMGQGRYQPHTTSGMHLLVHELTHVVQQGNPTADTRPARAISQHHDPSEREASRVAAALTGSPGTPASPELLQRQDDNPDAGPPVTDAGPGSNCPPSPNCPADFCRPFDPDPPKTARDKALEDRDRPAGAGFVLFAIRAINSRAAPLFEKYIFGGAPPQDISQDFATDFTNADATIGTTMLLVESLMDALKAKPPPFPPGADAVTVDINAVLGQGTIDQILKSMAFRNPFEVPGLIAGGLSVPGSENCLVGAQPSSQVDARFAAGTVMVMRSPDGTLVISPNNVTFTVMDTLDFCPGNCGGFLAQNVTVPMSRWEATGISGDLPFTVRFPAPPLTGAFGSESEG